MTFLTSLCYQLLAHVIHSINVKFYYCKFMCASRFYFVIQYQYQEAFTMLYYHFQHFNKFEVSIDELDMLLHMIVVYFPFITFNKLIIIM